VTVTLSYTNSGSAAATAVQLRDAIPAGMAYVGGSGRWSVTGAGTTLTDAAESGLAMDLSVSADGHGAWAYVRHRHGVDHSTVAAAVFRVGRDGTLRRRVDATWQQPVEATVDVTASASSTSITLGSMLGPFFPSPLTYYGVHP